MHKWDFFLQQENNYKNICRLKLLCRVEEISGFVDTK